MKLAVDANIARAAGDVSMHPVSKSSRELLKYIMDRTNAKIILCGKLQEEWKRHRSGFAKTWYTSMIARKRVEFASIDTSIIDSRIESIPGALQNVIEDAKKDSHLIILAQGDKIIFSNETNARRIFENNRTHLPEVLGIVWRSPVDEWDICIEICDGGCNLHKYAI